MVAWQCQGLGPALTPLTTSGMALECPLVSRPRHASCDLVTRALRKAPDLLCALSPPQSPFRGLLCVRCDLRASCVLLSGPSG